MRSMRATILIALAGILFIAPGRAEPSPPESTSPAASARVGQSDLWYMGEQEHLFEEVLGLAGLTFDTFRLEPDVVTLWGGDRYRLPLFDLFFRDIWTVSPIRAIWGGE